MHSIPRLLFVLFVLIAGCSAPLSDFDLASRAVLEGNTNQLAVIIARNRGVVTGVAPWDDGTLLHHALGSGSLVSDSAVECAKLLVAAGADVNKADRTGATPLHLVCRMGASRNAIAFLLDHGAEVNVRDPGGNTPLGSLLKRAKSGGFVDQAGADMLNSHGATE